MWGDMKRLFVDRGIFKVIGGKKENEKTLEEKKQELYNKINNLQGQLDLVKEKDKLEKLREIKIEQAIDTRKKTLIGAFVLQHEDIFEMIVKSSDFNNFVIRNFDRKLFAFPLVVEKGDDQNETDGQEKEQDDKEFSEKMDENI
ncbi:hypothetical protein FACS1894187_19190 [Synergistales bacterium]|nr:hypothetical protein FACS1894187_19190 [Synergistales bacterium]